jgi:RimJ/RimL family protein N-acetyltransferase
MNLANLAYFDLQPVLQTEKVLLEPLLLTDFERLYAIASDPLIWEQHPNKDRYQRTVFKTYFEGAIASGGAFLISDKLSNQCIGSSRFYDWDVNKEIILIGYTFIARSFWGRQYNAAIKNLMMQHAFQYANSIHFHVGASNIRSQVAMQRIGGKKIGEIEVAYYGEPPKVNVVFEIRKQDWIAASNH